ncbi:uncharacterized protein GGS25DRAFT_355806 [Hypoxylon fragiforme]|uniref:uncharacterized protein n=1 Tax=Hypoxylon fragiforme TaxID=63214 RepID=UPI0020C5D9DA|nr:uncharacterized protein GGS25DRAFT_355806 [Hypoxylon fragiforme]KAI2605764.1 hypothetical protein GGS25DRAFT_355806 [Hypoxylon fragiforme]
MSTSSGSRPTSRNYDTGFPDAFAEYTTSLRHPDADVSPNACIAAEDIDPSKSLHRARRSFLARHSLSNKHTISHGMLAQTLNRKRSSHSSLVMTSADSGVDVGHPKRTDTNGSIGGSSKDGAESIVMSLNDDSPPSSPMSPSDEQAGSDGRQKIKLFRKWRSQKD